MPDFPPAPGVGEDVKEERKMARREKPAPKRRVKQITFEMTVTVPADTKPDDVKEAINRQLDEPPADWHAWTVGAALITGIGEPHEEEAA